MIKNIVFDLGAVVVDWDPGRLVREYTNREVNPQELFKNGFFDKYWPEFDRGTYSEEEIIEKMSQHSGYSIEGCTEAVTHIKHSLVDIPRTVRLIEVLKKKGYRLFCLTNMSYEFYDYLKFRDVFANFEGQVVSAHESLIKPEAAIYQVLLSRYNLVPEETLFIDDLKANIDAAERQGIQTVWFADKEKGYLEIDQKLGL